MAGTTLEGRLIRVAQVQTLFFVFIRVQKTDVSIISSLIMQTMFSQPHFFLLISLSQVSAGGDGTRQVVWIDCGIHAREWISPATCQWVLDQLTSGYNADPGITELLDAYDFHILPVVNPDGYAFSWDEVSARSYFTVNIFLCVL